MSSTSDVLVEMQNYVHGVNCPNSGNEQCPSFENYACGLRVALSEAMGGGSFR